MFVANLRFKIPKQIERIPEKLTFFSCACLISELIELEIFSQLVAFHSFVPFLSNVCLVHQARRLKEIQNFSIHFPFETIPFTSHSTFSLIRIFLLRQIFTNKSLSIKLLTTFYTILYCLDLN